MTTNQSINLFAIMGHRPLTVFSCRVVNLWNSLPAERINFSSLASFRLSLLNVDFSKFLTID